MNSEALEVMIEGAWLKLAELDRFTARTVYLSRWANGGIRLVGIDRLVPERAPDERHEVGTYTRAATLQQFREDVFFVFDQVKGRKAA